MGMLSLKSFVFKNTFKIIFNVKLHNDVLNCKIFFNISIH